MMFGPLVVRYDERVLRPRPWTLAQSLWAGELLEDLPAGPLLELCAGVGHMGLMLATLTTRELVLIDADAHACDLAVRNADAAGLDHVEVRHGPLETMLGADERFALILADPPWVPTAETARFPKDPVFAIDGGPDGLDLARTCVEAIGRHLSPAGAGILQLGTEDQASRIATHLRTHARIGLGVEEVRTFPDGDGVLAKLTAR
jgi:methylase of polypeptide subunit release factors